MKCWTFVPESGRKMRERNPCEVDRADIDGAASQALFESTFPAKHVVKYTAPVEEVKQLERELSALENK
jgi:hypothetical protein